MTGAYAYTPDIWLPLAGALLMAAMGLYGWRRRRLPGAPALIVAMLCGIVLLSGMLLGAAAVTPGTKIAWFKFRDAWLAPSATAGACFVLEYVRPGRWLTRRSLSLLALPPLLEIFLAVANDGRLLWRQVEIGPDGSVVATLAPAGAIITSYLAGLGLVIAATLIWLYVRSPLHRWPAVIMLLGQVGGRGLFLLSLVHPPLLSPIDLVVLATLSPLTAYAIALFGFRILDPLPAARQMALEQMREGLVVFDAQWRVASLNPAAEALLSTPAAHARGKVLAELLPAVPDLGARGADNAPQAKQRRFAQAPALSAADGIAGPADITLGTGPEARYCVLDVSPLHDFRGLTVGYVLILHDETERRRTQAQILEQQRALATLQERDRIARELHDNLGQVLGFVKLQAQSARDLLARNQQAKADEFLARLQAVAQDAHTDVREYILGSPGAQPAGTGFFAGLRQYLQQFSKNHGLAVELVTPPDLAEEALAPVVSVQLLRIIQEALTNVRKHAQARSVCVTFSVRDCRAQVTIQDDGAGFDPARAGTAEGSHFGLGFMRERAQEVSGTVEIASAPGQGTRVIVSVPLRVP